ncbi:MAG TPA: hypothetical protein PKD17_10985 [Cellvibrionaceae bacterium]|nr:hypothetical protein [Cellvibrionaceae bacterium]
MPKRPARHNGLPKAYRLLGAALAMAGGTLQAAEPLDWVPKERLTPEQQKRMGPSCSGLYLDPLAQEPAPQDLDKAPICVDANGAHMSEGQTMRLNGDVVITQSSRRLKAGQMLYDKQGDEAALCFGVGRTLLGVKAR